MLTPQAHAVKADMALAPPGTLSLNASDPSPFSSTSLQGEDKGFVSQPPQVRGIVRQRAEVKRWHLGRQVASAQSRHPDPSWRMSCLKSASPLVCPGDGHRGEWVSLRLVLRRAAWGAPVPHTCEQRDGPRGAGCRVGKRLVWFSLHNFGEIDLHTKK